MARRKVPLPPPPAPEVLAGLAPLGRDFYDRGTVKVAKALLGQWLVHDTGDERRVGRIVETEAYLGLGDLAAHTARGQTPRTRVMFGPPGFAYVYLIYGMYHLLNLVTEPEGTGTAVLIRALEPVVGLDGTSNGPGKLCRALAVDMTHYGADLCADASTLFVAKPPRRPRFKTIAAPRVGVDYAGEEWAAKPLRFYIDGNRFVSKG